jgi:hypothetical protein
MIVCQMRGIVSGDHFCVHTDFLEASVPSETEVLCRDY